MHFRSASGTVPRPRMLLHTLNQLDEGPPGCLKSCIKLTKNPNFKYSRLLQTSWTCGPTYQSGLLEKEIDREQNLWVGLLDTAQGSLSIPGSALLPPQDAKTTPQHGSLESFCQNFPRDDNEKLCSDLGQVRLWHKWLWCIPGPWETCAIQGCRHHLQPICRGLSSAGFLQSLWLNKLIVLDFSSEALIGCNHTITEVTYGVAWPLW